MNIKDYIEQLAACAGNKGEGPSNAASEGVIPIWAPYDNFFGNNLFLLLYHNKDPLPPELQELKMQLYAVTSEPAPSKKQAYAAIKLGRFVQPTRALSGQYFSSSTQATEWFELAATHCESVIGVDELAKESLATHEKIKIVQDLKVDLLPRLVSLDDAGNSSNASKLAISTGVSDIWKRGMRLALSGESNDFFDWDKESLIAAISCIVNFLTFAPKSHRSEDASKTRLINLEVLKWAGPTWSLLIDALHDKELAKELNAQRQAVLMVVKGASETSGAEDLEVVALDTQSEHDSVVVIKGVIPSATDRDDVKQLAQYEVLRKAVKFISLPSIAALKVIRTTLQDEFPWAKDAIAITMSEMFARKVHGSKRLGMQPVLLVGSPGTGKTRFAQRLSELLGTPSTVINMSGMTDVKVLKGVTRGWATNRPSRILEVIKQSLTANPLFILDEVDKANGSAYGGNPQDALLDLLEPGNARRYSDIYLMTECDVSHALYILTANSLEKLSAPLKSRLRIVFFPGPGAEHSSVIVTGILYDLEKAWNVPAGTLTLDAGERAMLVGLSPREMRRAILELFDQAVDSPGHTLH